MLSFPDAQHDMRRAYYNGATGAVASATAWLAAALVATFADAKTGMLTLIFGGMVIFPLSVVLSKILGRTGQHAKDNPLAPLAISGTIWMLLSIPIAIAVSLHRIEWFFPAMLLVIGGRYLTFATLYGLKTYWIFGAVLALSVAPLIALNASVATGAFTGAILEYLFGLALFATRSPADPAPTD